MLHAAHCFINMSAWPHVSLEQLSTVPVPPNTGPIKHFKEYVLATHEVHPFQAASAPTHEELVQAGGMLLRQNPMAIGMSGQVWRGRARAVWRTPHMASRQL